MMTMDQARLLVSSLRDRIAGDRSRYLGWVSDQEIEALSALLENARDALRSTPPRGLDPVDWASFDARQLPEWD